ncbi:heterokaryon incompatibility protein-domain-containing protein [Trametes gibbosa]|nr:heterokaryon incompatibility protein-domain-containing protein [Trametes gibbosa]
MARFIDTRTGEFRWINDPSTVTYAILSHRWDENGEQTFPEVEELRKELSGTDSLLKHPKLSAKIRGICKVAREAGYQLIWIDSCCIDKTKSAELAEALNSMFELYRLAAVCYVYLADVPFGEDPRVHDSKFRKSEWHTRGWTLQEVIAPTDVVFLTSEWAILGTKMTLASTLEEISGIDFGILVGTSSLDSVSVAQRMSWAASRRTTRVEDEAYSLLGIFKVYLSPIYGEGRNAFIRLQEEILRTIPDQSLFAWGAHCTLSSLDVINATDRKKDCPTDDGLLAQSPRSFVVARGVRTLSISQFSSILDVSHPDGRRLRALKPPPIHSIVTPQGIRMQLVCADLAPRVVHRMLCHGRGLLRKSPCENCLHLGRATRLALLRCVDQNGHLIALALFEPRSSSDSELRGTPIATHKKCKSRCSSHSPYRIVRLAREAWSELRDYLLDSPVGVTLLRHGALQSSSTIASRPTQTAFNLWPCTWNEDVAKYPLAAIHLAPECEEVLRSLGCTMISPFRSRRASHSETKIVVTTSLCIPALSEASSTEQPLSVFDSEDEVSPQNISHHIDIEIKLESSRSVSYKHDERTMVHFSITSFVHARAVPQNQSKGRGVSNEVGIATTPKAATCDFCHTTRPRSLPVPPSTEALRTMFIDLVDEERQTIAQTDFVIHTDAPGASPTEGDLRTGGAMPVRMLRISLQDRGDTSTTISPVRLNFYGDDEDEECTLRLVPKLWLTIELSENHWQHPEAPDGDDLPRPATIRREQVDSDVSLFGEESESDNVFTRERISEARGKHAQRSSPRRWERDPSPSEAEYSKPQLASARRSRVRNPFSLSSSSEDVGSAKNKTNRKHTHTTKQDSRSKNTTGRRFR